MGLCCSKCCCKCCGYCCTQKEKITAEVQYHSSPEESNNSYTGETEIIQGFTEEDISCGSAVKVKDISKFACNNGNLCNGDGWNDVKSFVAKKPESECKDMELSVNGPNFNITFYSGNRTKKYIAMISSDGKVEILDKTEKEDLTITEKDDSATKEIKQQDSNPKSRNMKTEVLCDMRVETKHIQEYIKEYSDMLSEEKRKLLQEARTFVANQPDYVCRDLELTVSLEEIDVKFCAGTRQNIYLLHKTSSGSFETTCKAKSYSSYAADAGSAAWGYAAGAGGKAIAWLSPAGWWNSAKNAIGY